MVSKPLIFWRSCQSARTGFVHLFDNIPGGDVIPLYENFSFAAALFREKTVEGVLEGKGLLERLFAFQTREGNFPLFLHDYPRAWSSTQPLRIAPILIFLLREFKEVLAEDFQEKVRVVLACMIAFASHQSYDPLWERRYQALLGCASDLPRKISSSHELSQELITAQLLGHSDSFARELIHPIFNVYVGPFLQETQQGREPKAASLELATESLPLPQSFHHDGWEMRQSDTDALTYSSHLGLRWIWKGSGMLHSLVLHSPGEIRETEDGILVMFDLPELLEMPRSDLFEMAFFCNLSPETEMWVEGKKATLFSLGQSVSIQTPEKEIRFCFELVEGEGQFLGHLYRGNRPGQTLKEAYDWKISLRTIARTKPVRVRLLLQELALQPCPSHEDHCLHTALLP
jgi:hypothetical protein